MASWLFAIAANACRDRRRRDRRASVVPLEAVAEPRASGEGIEATIASRAAPARRARGPGRALRGAARGAGPRPLPRHALRRDRPHARDLGRRRQDPHLPGRRDPEGPFFRGRTLMDCRDVNALAIERLDRRSRRERRAGSCRRTWRPARAAAREMAALEERLDDARQGPRRRRSRPTSASRTLALLEEEMLRDRVRDVPPAAALACARCSRRPRCWLAASLGYLAARGLPHATATSRPPSRRRRGSGPAAPAAAPLPDLTSNPRLSNVSYRPADKDGTRRHRFRRDDAPRARRAAGRPGGREAARLPASRTTPRPRARSRGRSSSSPSTTARSNAAGFARDRGGAVDDAAQGREPGRAQEGRRRARVASR